MFRIRDVEGDSGLRAMMLVALWSIVVFIVWAAVSLGHAAADTPNRAGIVVTFGDGRTVSQCIEFTEQEISGADLLKRTGLPLVSLGGGMGAAVCKIDDIGCDNPDDCFCQCHGASCQYWAYYTLQGGQWEYSNAGASLRKVHHGDVDGWAWGSGKIGSGAAPEMHTFEEICPPPSQPTAPPPPTEPPPPVAEPTIPLAVESPVVEPTSVPTVGLAATAQRPMERPTSQPVVAEVLPARSAAEAETPDDGGSGFPPQLIAFAGLAALLAVTAVVLVRRRAHG